MKVVVIGGGISGLTTAWWIRDRATERGIPLDLQLLEASERLGGTIFTDHRDGYRCEWGPNGFLDSKPSTLELVDRLGLTDHLLPSSDSARRRFVVVDGALVELPGSPGAFMKSPILSLSGRLRVLREPWVRRGTDQEETVAAFARRRLGQQAFERLVDPFVSGIFAGDPDRLVLRAAFPRLAELEEEYGSLITASRKLSQARAKSDNAAGPSGRLTCFEGGMSVLIEALGASLGETIRVNEPVTAIRRIGERWILSTPTDMVSEIDHVVVATPAFAAAKLLAPLDSSFSGPLAGIPYAAATVVALGCPIQELSHDLNGFGFLCPTTERRRILGCLWSSSVYPGCRAPEGHALVRCIVGGSRAPELAVLPDDELVPIVRHELADLMGINIQPTYVNVIRHLSAIPQYEYGHLSRLRALDETCERWPGLSLVGNAYRGVGINDCTREAKRIASEVVS